MTALSQPKSIRYFGTSWVDRGFTYWRKRIVMTTFCAMLLALSTWFVSLIVDAVATNMRGTGRTVLLAILVACLLWSFAYGFSLTRRTPEERALGVPPIMRSRSTAESRERAGWAGVSAGVVAGPLVVIAQIFVIGTLAAAVFTTLQRYVSIEEFEAATGKRVPRRQAGDYASPTLVRFRRGGETRGPRRDKGGIVSGCGDEGFPDAGS